MCQKTPSLPPSSRGCRKVLVSLVHTDELVILRDDLLLLLVIENEVFDVIEQLRLREQARDHALEARALFWRSASRSIFSFSSSARSQMKKYSHSAVMLPTFVSMALVSTQKAFVRKNCGISVL